VRAAPGFDTAKLALGERVPIDWVDVPEPNPAEDTVRQQAHARGAARFARTEGLWLAGDELFMCATIGGPIGRGQILRVRHAGPAPELSVVAHSDDAAALDMPDNITVAPSGALFVAEDGSGDNWLRCVTREGVVNDFARNALSTSELSGPCFSPDGKTLFVNIQHDGLTLAIQGPFERAATLGTARQRSAGADATALVGLGLGTGALALTLGALMRRRRARAATPS
jgi:secreted PhoX family phosphatase